MAQLKNDKEQSSCTEERYFPVCCVELMGVSPSDHCVIGEAKQCSARPPHMSDRKSSAHHMLEHPYHVQATVVMEHSMLGRTVMRATTQVVMAVQQNAGMKVFDAET